MGRIVERDRQLQAIEAAARRAGAIAFHVAGSLGRGEGDVWSDIDVWVTFPDEVIGGVIADRWALYGEVGEILIAHETAHNRTVGGIYSLVIYQTPVGPMIVDWSLMPRASSRVDEPTMVVFEDEPILAGERLMDHDAVHVASREDSITWLICMLHVAIKKVARGGKDAFIPFLGERYREIGNDYRFGGLQVTEPGTFANISGMLRQLVPESERQQRRAIRAIDDWLERIRLTALA
jgi:hypothetical protein